MHLRTYSAARLARLTGQMAGSTTQIDAGALLDAILDAKWMIRRKDAVAFGTESLLRRTHSFDFEVRPELVVLGHSDRVPATATIPLGFWWKAPGKYTNIDFVDEAETSIPLSTSEHDNDVTLAVMLEYASRVLAKPTPAISAGVTSGITYIVEAEAISARNEVKNSWLHHRRSEPFACRRADREWHTTNPSTVDQLEVAFLARHDGFASLLEVCAMASVFTVVLHGRHAERRIVKLRYDETCTGLRGTDTYAERLTWQERASDRCRAVLLLFGLAPYTVDIANAFVRARRYHFEEDAPSGLRFANVTSKRALNVAPTRAAHTDPRVHLYEKDLMNDTYLTVRGKLTVTDEWLNLALVCTAITISVLVGIARNIETLDPTSSQSVITLAILVPSIAMSIVWRRVHWLVVRLQRWLRLAFGSVGVLLFYLALRIAESPTTAAPRAPGSIGEPGKVLSDASQIEDIAVIILGWAILVALLLILARIRSKQANHDALRPSVS